LLRVLQDQEFERLGGNQTLKVNFRLIVATNRDLQREVTEQRFRSDLFYRLNVFPIRILPLRERRTDIPALVEYFVRKHAQRMNKGVIYVQKKTVDALTRWSWPGNVRELENFVERAMILTQGSVLAAPLGELEAERAVVPSQTLELVEREHILHVLKDTGGRLSGPSGAAARLGVPRTTLQSKLRKLRINHREYQTG
jgi:formate hydrogenlyase transcriptional activator